MIAYETFASSSTWWLLTCPRKRCSEGKGANVEAIERQSGFFCLPTAFPTPFNDPQDGSRRPERPFELKNARQLVSSRVEAPAEKVLPEKVPEKVPRKRRKIEGSGGPLLPPTASPLPATMLHGGSGRPVRAL